jgi:hypothetical protein
MYPKLVPGVNDLATVSPALAQEAAGWDPTTVTAKSTKKVRWRCPLGHEWESIIHDRVKLNSRCHVCSNRIVLAGFNDLATTHPDLAAEADGWDPTTMHKGTNKKVAWRCAQGHTWNAQISARTSQNQGCAVCIGRAVKAGFNDLGTTHPDIAREAFGWDPRTLTAGSQRKVGWRCDKGHTWETQVAKRKAGNGCPVCSNFLIVSGVNDIATLRPDLASEAVGWDPSTVGVGAVHKRSWRCQKGHVYSQSPKERNRGQGCNICSNHVVLPGHNDLATTHPAMAEQADGWDPKAVVFGSHAKRPWRCEKGHTWTATPKDRTARNQGCPFCSGNRVWPGFNDMATTRPDLAAEADGWDPKETSAGTHHVLAWRCKEGHAFRASANQRTSRTSNCPTCANLVVLPGFNDLSTTHPDLAVQASGWDPTTVGGGSSLRLLWKCQHEHEWESTPVNRTWNKAGCPVCVNQLVLVGHNDLAHIYPDVARQACGWDPTTELAGSKHKKLWRCDLGHEWKAVIQARTIGGHGCPFCGNKRVLPGFNDLATRYPAVAAQAVGWDPAQSMPGGNIPRLWRCVLGHEWVAAPNNRTQQGQNCPYCSNKRVLIGYNDLATTHPYLIAEALFDPTAVVAGHDKKLPWLCNQCGHKWSTTPHARVGGTNCPACAPGGYNPGEAAWLYLFGHDKWEMLQVGITNELNRRTREHTKNGWHLIDMRGPMDGTLTQAWERSILDYLKARKVPTTPSTTTEEPSRAKGARGPRSGEAWWASDLNVTSVIELMNLIHESEEVAGPIS